MTTLREAAQQALEALEYAAEQVFSERDDDIIGMARRELREALDASKINTGGPAFPSHGSMSDVVQEGMTLRDYFAAKAMQGLLLDDNGDFSDRNWMAEEAYAFADAMLKARSNT